MANPESLFRIMVINSRYKVNGTNNDFIVDFSDDPYTHKVSSVHILSASLVHSFYNIRTGINDTLKINTGASGLLTIVAPEGFYTTSTLLTEIKTQFDLLTGAVITFTQSTLTDIVSYSIAGETADFLSEIDDSESTMANNIGVTNSIGALLALASFESTPNLAGVRHIFIGSSTINNGGSLLSASGTFSNDFMSIPVDVPYRSLITYNSSNGEHSDTIIYNLVRDLSTIRIQVRDERGEFLGLSNNNDVVIVLKVHYVP